MRLPPVSAEPLFFCDEIKDVGSTIEITGDEAVHILQSRRLKVDDSLILTNGKGVCAEAIIQNIDQKKNNLSVAITSMDHVSSSRTALTLAAAIPKGDRQSTLLNMCTQLGMSQYIPLVCDRSVTKYQPRMKDRWQRIISEACKQSGQYYFPSIGDEATLASIVNCSNQTRYVIVGNRDGNNLMTVGQKINSNIKEIVMLVGPEGGFSEQENEFLDTKKILKLQLGQQILRTETAAVALLSAVNQLKL